MLEKSFQQATPSRVPLQYFVTLVSRSAIRVPVPGAIPQSARGRIHIARFRRPPEGLSRVGTLEALRYTSRMRSVSSSGRRENSRRSERTYRSGWPELDPPPTGDFILFGMDHISVPVTDVARTKAFYEAILMPLGGHARAGAPTSTLALRREVRRHFTLALPIGLPRFILHSRLTARRRSKSSIVLHLMLVERTMASLVPVLVMELPTTLPSPWIRMDTTSKPSLVVLGKPESADPDGPSNSDDELDEHAPSLRAKRSL
jgi:hypothetical protein